MRKRPEKGLDDVESPVGVVDSNVGRVGSGVFGLGIGWI